MKNWLQKYNSHHIIFEIMCAILIILSVAIIGYHSFLQILWKNFSQTRVHYFVIQKAFEQKKSAAQKEKIVALSLKNWQKKHPNFYRAIKNLGTTNDRSEILTKIIQHSQLTITHVNSHHTLSVQATGNFSDLLTLLSALNKNALPFTLMQLSNHHVHHLKMQFSFRENYVKK